MSATIHFKPVHGAPVPFWREHGLLPYAPIPYDTDLQVGDHVIYTNDYGLKSRRIVVGFSRSDMVGGYIHLVSAKYPKGEGSCWWFPHKASSLKKIVEVTPDAV